MKMYFYIFHWWNKDNGKAEASQVIISVDY